MHKHSAYPYTTLNVDDWDERDKINDALHQLVDEAELDALGQRDDEIIRHSDGEIDRDAEFTALAEWFGIE